MLKTIHWLLRRGLLVLGLYLSNSGVLAAQMEVVLIADTASPTGGAAALDAERIRHELHALGAYTGHDIRLYLLSEEQATATQITAQVNSLNPGADDVILLYYLGHGYRSANKSDAWPYLHLTKSASRLDLRDLVDTIISKRPRMAWVVADCCNNVIQSVLSMCAALPMPLKGYVPELEPGYRALFNDFEGVIVTCGSEAGDYAYCHSKGHFYTEALFVSLHEEVKSTDPQWSHLLDRAARKVSFLQTPYYEILEYP